MTRGRKREKNAGKRDDRRDIQGYGDVTVFESAITRARKRGRRGY